MQNKEKPTDKAIRLEKEAAENMRVLQRCARHCFDFQGYDGVMRTSNSLKIHCARCGGKCSLRSAMRYVSGYISSGRPQSDVAFNLAINKAEKTVVCPHCKGAGVITSGSPWLRGDCGVCARVGTTTLAAAVAWLNSYVRSK